MIAKEWKELANIRLALLMDATEDFSKVIDEIKQLREENEKLKKLISEPITKSEWQLLTEENEKLKAENEQLNLYAHTITLTLNKANKQIDALAVENEQLKAQLRKAK